MGEEQPGQIADLLCDEEIVPHETLDARHAGPVGIAHAPGDFGLDVEGQPFLRPLCDAVQVAADRPEEVFGLLELSQLGAGQRSEEHTSELQSLMRTSNAVLCLKKKKKTQ